MEQLNAAQRKAKFEKIKNYYEKECKKYDIDPQAWDVYANCDLSLDILSNKGIVNGFIEKMKTVKQKAETMTKPEAEEEKRKIKQYVHQQILQHNKAYYDKLNSEPNETIDRLDKPIHDAVSKVIHTGIPSVIIEGRAGNGKSHAVDVSIKREKVQERARIYTTTLTKAFFFRVLYENRQKGQIIILRDINPFTKDLLNMMKAATETTEPRIIHKNNYSKENDDLEDSFRYEGSIIMEVNAVPLESDIKMDVDAIISRSLYVPFHLSVDELKAKIRAIAQGDPEKMMVANEILGLKEGHMINLRTYYHAMKTYEWAKKKNEGLDKEYGDQIVEVDWKEVLQEDLKRISMSREYYRVFALIGEKWVPKSQLIKMMVTVEHFSVRTARRQVNDLKDADILQEASKFVGLKPIEEIREAEKALTA